MPGVRAVAAGRAPSITKTLSFAKVVRGPPGQSPAGLSSFSEVPLMSRALRDALFLMELNGRVA